MGKDYYSVKEVADILHKSRQQVNIDIRLGKIKAEKVGKAYIIKKSEIDKIK